MKREQYVKDVKNKVLGISLILVLMVMLCCWPVGSTLLLGWAGFLARNLPRLSPDWATVAAALVAVGLFTLGVHWVGRMTTGTSPVARWKLRWSGAVTALLFMLFASGVAMVGLAHMSLWLARSPKPIRVEPGGIQRVAARMKSANQMKMIGLGIHNYSDVYGAQFPAAATFDESGRALHGWVFHILPYMTYSAREIDPKVPWNEGENARFFRSVLPEFVNPRLSDAPVQDQDGFGLNHYSGSSHLFLANRSLKLADVTDGLSDTILGGEINNHFQPWGKPMNVRDPGRGINRSPRGFGGPRGAGGAQMLLADFSVRFISEKASPEVLRALATPAGGEKVDERELHK